MECWGTACSFKLASLYCLCVGAEFVVIAATVRRFFTFKLMFYGPTIMAQPAAAC
jgi:hypothetical protein